MRLCKSAVPLVISLTVFFFVDISYSREFTDPGTAWVLGAFNYEHSSAAADGSSETVSSDGLMANARIGYFVGQNFFLGPLLGMAHSWNDNSSSSTTSLGGQGGIASRTLGAPMIPYVGASFSFAGSTYSFSGFSSSSSSDEKVFGLFGGFIFEMDHLGLGMEAAYTHPIIDHSSINIFGLNFVLSGLFY